MYPFFFHRVHNYGVPAREGTWRARRQTMLPDTMRFSNGLNLGWLSGVSVPVSVFCGGTGPLEYK